MTDFDSCMSLSSAEIGSCTPSFLGVGGEVGTSNGDLLFGFVAISKFEDAVTAWIVGFVEREGGEERVKYIDVECQRHDIAGFLS